MTDLVPADHIERSILVIRGQKVMLDADLAGVYRVQTRALNQAVKRNRHRFPEDFMFQLTREERDEVITKRDHLRQLKFSPTLPYAFTEHGAIMLASVLRSRVAIRASVHIVRTFIRLREVALSHKELRHKLNALEKKYDAQFKVVFDAIRKLMEPPPGVAKRRIGFRPLPPEGEQ
jgi:hypothetical protein